MRCPRCHDEYEPGMRECAECRVALVDDHTPGPAGDVGEPGDDHEPAPALRSSAPPRARLGRFHPAVAERVAELLDRRAVGHTLRAHDDGVEILVEGAVRDELRTEFFLGWDAILRGLDAATAADVRAGGGAPPGWFDAPRGGHVDRDGRTVLELADEEAEEDASRVVGPTLLTVGAIAAIGGWYLLSSPALMVVGIGLAVLGIFTPR